MSSWAQCGLMGSGQLALRVRNASVSEDKAHFSMLLGFGVIVMKRGASLGCDLDILESLNLNTPKVGF